MRIGLIDALSLTDDETHGGLAGLRRVIGMSVPEIVEEVTPVCADAAVLDFPPI